MSGLGDLIAVVTAVAAVLAGRAAYVGHRARRRLAAAVTGRSDGHALGATRGSPAGGGAGSRGRGPDGPYGDDGGWARGGHEPADVEEGEGRAGDLGVEDTRLPGHRSGGDMAADGRGEHEGDSRSAASWSGAAMPDGASGTAGRDGEPLMAGTSAGGPASRPDGTARGAPGPGGPASGRRPAGDVTAGWRSPPGVAGIVLGACAVALVAGLGVVLAGMVVAGVAAVGRRARDRTAERNQRRAQLPVALDRLASALHGGASVPAALAAAGDTVPPPLGPELAALGREADGGRAVADVLDQWADRRGDAGTRLAATALVLAGPIGASPARAAHGVATTLRERAYLADERRSLASQARLSGLVLSVAPIGFTVLVGAADPGTRHFLLHTPPGWACLTIGLALDAAGAWWMSVLTRGSDR